MRGMVLMGLALTLPTAVVGVPAQDGRAVEIDNLIEKTTQMGIFSGNVLVVEKGKVVYEKAIGFSDASKTKKLDNNYRFNVGSIAKEFNAVGIMMMKERGKLALDDKVSKFLPDLPVWANQISVRNLLQYTSGLPDIKWETARGNADVLADLMKVESLEFEPGSKYAYNNTNVFLQRQIIERITGEAYGDFLRKEMLKPCGMRSTVVDPDIKKKGFAVSFNNDLVADPRQFYYPFSGWPSVTAKDLYSWTQCLNAGKLINKASVREIITPVSPGRQAGLGGGIMEGEVLKEHWHDGQSLDFEALMYDKPSAKVTIVLLSNNKNFKLQDIRRAISLILAGKPYSMPKRSILLAVSKKMGSLGAEGIIKLYNETAGSDAGNVDREADLNQIGYSLMGDKKIDEAIKIFEYVVKMYPGSGNAYDSLGEAYLNKGDRKAALTNYKKALEFDPTNSEAAKIIKSLDQ